MVLKRAGHHSIPAMTTDRLSQRDCYHNVLDMTTYLLSPLKSRYPAVSSQISYGILAMAYSLWHISYGILVVTFEVAVPRGVFTDRRSRCDRRQRQRRRDGRSAAAPC